MTKVLISGLMNDLGWVIYNSTLMLSLSPYAIRHKMWVDDNCYCAQYCAVGAKFGKLFYRVPTGRMCFFVVIFLPIFHP